MYGRTYVHDLHACSTRVDCTIERELYPKWDLAVSISGLGGLAASGTRAKLAVKLCMAPENSAARQ